MIIKAVEYPWFTTTVLQKNSGFNKFNSLNEKMDLDFKENIN